MNGVISIQKRRAVSQIIGTMMILAITVAGAVFLSTLMSNEFFAVDQNPVAEARIDSIRLTSYDTRDSIELTNIPNLNNNFDQMLCTTDVIGECTITSVDNLPVNGGTEFIVLQIRNMNINSVFIHNILINNVGHTWDESAVGDLVLTSDIGSGGNYPHAGTFSIIPVENDVPIKQIATNLIPGDGEVRLVIKLSGDIPQNIGMWSSLRVLVNFGGPEPAEFIILSGDAKW
jgi:FlaG/FlaF family flagellin (archaellin)